MTAATTGTRDLYEALAGREARALGYETGTGSRVVALTTGVALSFRYRIARR